MKPKKNNHLLLYAIGGGAVLALIFLIKKNKGSEEETAATYATAPGGIPAAGETTADSASQIKSELTSWETEQHRESQEQLGLLGETLKGQLGVLGEQLKANNTGEQKSSPSSGGPEVQSSTGENCSYGTECYVKAMEANAHANEAAWSAPAAPAPAPPVVTGSTPQKSTGSSTGYTTVRCGNGCEGHRHSNGQTDCQLKNSKGQCYWP